MITKKALRQRIGEALDFKINEYRSYGTYKKCVPSVQHLLESTKISRISELELQQLIDEEFYRAILEASINSLDQR